MADPFDGAGDLARGVVRAVGEPGERMREDRLRALRAIRFAARFDFAIDPATWRAIVESAPHLGRLSPERVREELEKTMRQVVVERGAERHLRVAPVGAHVAAEGGDLVHHPGPVDDADRAELDALRDGAPEEPLHVGREGRRGQVPVERRPA